MHFTDLTLPGNKKEERLRKFNQRLCVPLLYCRSILSPMHDVYGHNGVQRMFLTWPLHNNGISRVTAIRNVLKCQPSTSTH